MSGPSPWTGRAHHYAREADEMEPAMRATTDALLDGVGAGPGVRLLDLACGPGHVTAAAHARGADALGVDLTPAMVEAARRRFPDARFAVGDMLDPPPGPWDAITCRFGAHHVDDRWIQAAWHVLAPGGRLAIAELEAHDAASRAKGMRSARTWHHQLEEAGFEEVEVVTRSSPLGEVRILSGRRPARPTDA